VEIMARRPKDRPLFLLVHYMDVHQWRPWYFDKAAPGEDPLQNRDEVWDAYEKAVRDTDRHLTALLDRWNREVGLEESLVVFYADHGEHLIDPGREIMGHGNTMDEVLLHVPLVVHYPRGCGVAAGEVSAPVSLVDLAATVLELAGAPHDPGALQGRSLLHEPLPAGSMPARSAANVPGEEQDSARPLFADSQLFGDALSSVRSGPYKLVIDLETGGCRLLDIRLPLTDAGEPGQQIRDDEVVNRLKKIFESYARSAAEATADLKLDRMVDQDQALKDLKELGYAK
jgi:arylsulfatase A-like enzyme